MEDALHGNSDGLVVGVDRFWVVRAAGWAEMLSGGEKRLDGFVPQNHQRGHRPQAARQRFVAAGMADAADDVFAAEFLQIVSGVAALGVSGTRVSGSGIQVRT
jgi:hypothetical protein